MATPTVAYLTNRRLHVKAPGSEAEEVDSAFVRRQQDLAARAKKQHGWKSGNPIWGRMAGGDPFAGQLPEMPGRHLVFFSSMTPVPGAAALMYVLHTADTSGLFRYDVGERYEQRLVHRQGFDLADISHHPSEGKIACSIAKEDGTCSIGTAEADGGRLREVTEGDSRDEAPSWSRAPGHHLVYQSAGLGRNREGFVVGLGPYSVERLDLDRGEVVTMLEDEAFDHLAPVQLEDERLLYIRRPYDRDGGRKRLGVLDAVTRTLMFPVDFLMAGHRFLKIWTSIYSGKAAKIPAAGGLDGEGQPTLEPARLWLWGRVVEARDGAAAEAEGSLVDESWALMERTKSGEERQLAARVLSFDVASDGGVVISDGARVRYIGQDGQTEDLVEAPMIERVVAL